MSKMYLTTTTFIHHLSMAAVSAVEEVLVTDSEKYCGKIKCADEIPFTNIGRSCFYAIVRAYKYLASSRR
jgi:hypothetical protein